MMRIARNKNNSNYTKLGNAFDPSRQFENYGLQSHGNNNVNYDA